MQDQAVHVLKITGELGLKAHQVMAAMKLLGEGSTVPFIARYRKEVTGGLDEVAIIAIRDRSQQLQDLDTRREAVLKSIDEQGKLTEPLKASILAAETMAALEDIYLPYRPKRRTRAMIARERGLEPLAELLLAQDAATDPEAAAAAYVDAGKEVPTVADALAGARDILAEDINENADARARLRTLFAEEGVLTSKMVPGAEEKGAKFKDYFEWSEPIKSAPSHRILAIRRGAEEGVLSFRILPDEATALGLLERQFVRGACPAADQVRQAAQDSYKRLMAPSLETEIRLESKKRADADAIAVFADNLRELLLASPLGRKAVLALDPGLRTGCKLVCLDPQGKLLHHDVIYPLAPHNRVDDAAALVKFLVDRYQIEAIAVGNGTGGREAEAFCRGIDLGRSLPVVMVNESGASVYSASEVAREEFPEQDLTVRGAVSIGRRLTDPLAELVKIDPKSIGVGQYQHDVDPKLLRKGLDDVVVSCVNAVGVELNTASKQLLSYVSGLSERLAGNIVAYRNERGALGSRAELLKVPGMGPKTFEQAAGFLRVRESDNPLDGSAVHPERYGLVERMARDVGCSVADLIRDGQVRSRIDLHRYVSDDVGLPTLQDILGELARPGRDPRKQFEAFQFAEGVREITDLQPGMRLPGIVTNVAAFGAFVDVGVHQDGLVHVSQLADHFVKNPADVVKVQQRVMVTVLEVDLPRKRISLSMKSKPEARGEPGQAPRSGPRPQGKPQAKAPPKRRDEPKPFNNPFVDFFKDFKPKT